jgi:hypothetical protein
MPSQPVEPAKAASKSTMIGNAAFMLCYPACLLGLDVGLAPPRAALVDWQATKPYRTGISQVNP